MVVGPVGRSEDEEDARAQTEGRWILETAHTIDLMRAQHLFQPRSFILDYGCGAGRIAKQLIDQYGCEIIGADTSDGMRSLARSYVGKADRFHTLPPAKLARMHGRFDFAYCTWVLQHAESPRDDVARIARCLQPGGKLFVINETRRFVPTVQMGFAHDGIDIKAVLQDAFGEPLTTGHLDPKHTAGEAFAARTWWAVYQRKG